MTEKAAPEAYYHVKLQQIRNQSVTRIHGHPLELQNQQEVVDLVGETKHGPRFALQWCLCVQDSLDNPCHCDQNIIWLARSDVVASGIITQQKDHAGKSLYFFDLKNDSEILMERIQPLSVTTVKKMSALSRKEFERLLLVSTALGGLPFTKSRPIADIEDWVDLLEKLAIAIEESGILDPPATFGELVDQIRDWVERQ